MKPFAEQIESIAAPAMAAVRDAASSLREAEAQLEKLERKSTAARDTRDKKRIKLGEALVKAHREMKITQGDRSGRWARFLGEEDIATETARSYMKLANFVEDTSPTDDDVGEVPTYAEAGIDKRPRKTDREREEQPDDPSDSDEIEKANAVEVISAGCALDIRLGDWRQVLADYGVVDTIITDAPYGSQTHSSMATREDGSNDDGLTPDYEHWTPDDVVAFVEYWSDRCRGWIVGITSDDLIPVWKAAYAAAGRTFFAPVPCVITGMSCRMQGDGPSSWTVYAMVSRPKNLSKWGTLRGAYVGPRVSGSKSGRGKPPWLMEQIVEDYSRPGDIVCDPMAGYGETLLAAHKLRRRQIGAELVDAARREAIKRFHERKHDRLDFTGDDTKAEQAA